MGWSLGTNDAANAFGTAVATKVIKYRTAIIVISVMVMIGAILGGHNNIGKLTSIATNNEVVSSAQEVDQAIKSGLLEDMRFKSALKAFIIFLCAGLTVFVMSYLKFPVSANQAITGAVIGWGLCYADYSNPLILKGNLMEILEFMSTWLINPVGAALISFILVFIVKKYFEERIISLKNYDMIVKAGYLIAGAFAAYSIGQNSSASVTAFYYDATGKGANLLLDARFTAILGGIAISLGVLTFSKRVMMTLGGDIANISQVDGFIVIIAMSLTVILMGNTMGIPVSTSQSAVGAVVGAGLVKGIKNVSFGVFKRIAIAWISSPTVAGILAWVTAACTEWYFV